MQGLSPQVPLGQPQEWQSFSSRLLCITKPQTAGLAKLLCGRCTDSGAPRSGAIYLIEGWLRFLVGHHFGAGSITVRTDLTVPCRILPGAVTMFADARFDCAFHGPTSQ